VREYANPHSRECHPAAAATTHSISNSHVSGTVELIIGRHNLDEEASASERTHLSADVQLLARPVGDGERLALVLCCELVPKLNCCSPRRGSGGGDGVAVDSNRAHLSP